MWAGITSPPPKEKGIKVLPNPNDGRFTLWFPVHDKPGWVEVFDVTGKLILKEPVAPWSQYKQLNISHPDSYRDDGIYFVKMMWGVEEMSCKVIVRR